MAFMKDLSIKCFQTHVKGFSFPKVHIYINTKLLPEAVASNHKTRKNVFE